MKEIINELHAVAPAVAAIGGYAVGFVTEKFAQHHVDVQRTGVLSTQGASEEEFRSRRYSRAPLTDDVEAVGIPPKTLVEKLKDHASRAILPASMALAAGLSVVAWAAPEKPKTKDAVIEVIADHSFPTGQDGTIEGINAIARNFSSTKKLRMRTLVAHNGNYDAIDPSRLKADDPFGPPSLETTLSVAMTDAFNNAPTAKSTSLSKSDRRSAGILIVTDDNPIGDVDAVIKASHEQGDLPIFIANAGDNTDRTAQDLRKIAKKTGGKYWNASSKTEAVAQDIKDTIKPPDVASDLPDSNNLWEKIFSLASIALAAGLIKKRLELRFTGKKRTNEQGAQL